MKMADLTKGPGCSSKNVSRDSKNSQHWKRPTSGTSQLYCLLALAAGLLVLRGRRRKAIMEIQRVFQFI